MSSSEQAIDTFKWVDAVFGSGVAWVIIGGGTAVLLVIVVVVIILCMRHIDNEEKKKPLIGDDGRYSSGPYTGMVAVPICCTNDGIGPTLDFGPPPPYSVGPSEKVQPGRLSPGRISPLTFGYTTQYHQTSPYGQTLTAESPNGHYGNGSGLTSFGTGEKPAGGSGGIGFRSISPRPLSPRPLADSQSNYSSYSEEEDDQSLGKIWFSAVYHADGEKLEVEVQKASIVAVRDPKSTLSETFVKVYLLPDEQTSYQTKTKRKTMTPKFNEKFVFELSPDELSSRVLRLSAYVMDRRNLRSCLGHVLVNTEDISMDGEVVMKELQPNGQPSQLGDINYSMTYYPNNDKLKLTIVRCRNLKKLLPIPENEFDKPSLFIKVQFICDRKVLDKWTTNVQPVNLNPTFDESTTFSATPKQLGTASLVLTLMTSSARENEEAFEQIYGSSTVGPFMFAHGEELRHWQEMLAQPRTSITKWHVLQ